jgi:hypothetical protein
MVYPEQLRLRRYAPHYDQTTLRAILFPLRHLRECWEYSVVGHSLDR